MRNESNNPYDPPTAFAAKASVPRDMYWMRAILYVHLVAIIASAFVVRSEAILSSRLLELLIALPLLSTMIICPIAMFIILIASINRTVLFRGLAVASDFVLSAIQLLIWLPTVQ